VEKRSSHPFRAINSRSLKGVEIMDGGSIIMPMDMSVADTTMSISIKGMYRRKPISKARFSSLVMKDGTTTRIGRFMAASPSAGGSI
jgi:hypothetical protein